MTRREEIIEEAQRVEHYGMQEQFAFIAGAQWADKTMIDKACKWMEWIRQCGSYYGTNITKESIRDFRKTMESSKESVLDYIKLED